MNFSGLVLYSDTVREQQVAECSNEPLLQIASESPAAGLEKLSGEEKGWSGRALSIPCG